jgi:single-strand DNA-binding protein
MITASVAGNVGKDAELKQAGGDQVLEFSVASAKKVKNEEITTWVRCTIWGKRGVALAQYIKKGTPVTVSGDLMSRPFKDKSGAERASLEMHVYDVKLQGGKRDSGDAYVPPNVTDNPGSDPWTVPAQMG